MGHHPTYFTHFAAAMAETGAEVVPFCADPADFLKRLGNASLPSAVRERIAPPVRISGPATSRFRPTRWRGQYEAWRFFGGLGKQLRTWEYENSRKIDLVFFACIYDWQFANFHSVERFFGYSWSGLYLHARFFRMPGSPIPFPHVLPCPEKIFALKGVRSVAVLDEAAAAPLSVLAGKKPVVCFPDISETLLPEPAQGAGLAGKIKAFAQGRPVVSLTGHLQLTKGLEEFTASAESPAMKDVFFFLGGSVSWWGVGDNTRTRLEKSWEESGNIYVHPQALSEATMNAVIAASDVVFAAYRNFPNSSNVLTKAAIFERPVLVADGYLMAERVREFQLGEVVPEGDVKAIVQTLERMLAPGYYGELRQRARWADYREAHSTARLKKAMADLLEASLP